jgi:hypothetical protein
MVVVRNIVILSILESLEPNLAADVALHAMYSAFLTPRLRKEIRDVWTWLIDDRNALVGRGKIRFSLANELDSLFRALYFSAYTTETAQESLANGMNHPSRIDYLHRYLSNLRPGHRLSTIHYRNSGILAPFAADISGFIYPNRLVSQSFYYFH